MQINSGMTAALAAVLLALPALATEVGEALAFDPNATSKEAFRQGFTAYKSGDTERALDGFGFAAEKGHVAALWKLADMYATGDGVTENDRKAFEIFSRITEANAESDPRGMDAHFVSRAFVALGNYYHTGIPGAVQSDPARARRYFAFAGSYFGDAEAQFRLAEMYVNGQGGETSPRQGARWFKLAARKGHAGAQAMLGRLMLEGRGVRRDRVKGLMWLAIAYERQQADETINLLHEKAFAAASEAERDSALAMAKDWDRRQN